jgi:hypothetical protein
MIRDGLIHRVLTALSERTGVPVDRSQAMTLSEWVSCLIDELPPLNARHQLQPFYNYVPINRCFGCPTKCCHQQHAMMTALDLAARSAIIAEGRLGSAIQPSSPQHVYSGDQPDPRRARARR